MEKGFDWVWNVVPQLSAYQLFIAIVSGYVAFIGNISREKMKTGLYGYLTVMSINGTGDSHSEIFPKMMRLE